MGSVRIDVDHDNLMNLADYNSITCLKKLYRNYNNLHKLAEAGNIAAVVIWLDLKTGLQYENLTDKQQSCVYQHLVEGKTLPEIADECDVSTVTIFGNVTGGLRRIREGLRTGKCYNG